MNEMAEMNVWL